MPVCDPPVCENLFIDDGAARCRLPNHRHVAIECTTCTDYAPEHAPDVEATVLHEEDRTRCEVWTRVMGYHRPVSAWNAGKQQEHRDRVQFREGAGHD